MSNLGIFLGSGGNKVFFVNGVLKVFSEESIHIDHLVGLSSSSAIIFAHLFSCHDYILEVFGSQLKRNESNFYLLGKEKFPHNEIYESSVRSMFDNFEDNSSNTSYSIIASKTSNSLMRTKAVIASLAMGLRQSGINIYPPIKKTLGITQLTYDSRSSEVLSNNDLIDLIVGSSTIYPFIGLHTLDNKLILEGELAEVDPLDYLIEFDKKIIINTEQGITRVENGVLQIYSSQKIPNNILDYTDDSKIRTLQNNGESEARKNLDLITDYILDKL
ncbi:patatin-like phospholipase family protein [Candidatus Woesearchaeota archaeon]|jgi:hypothetical protein|nr:patatin-like phospholipase family protein [Candidatus Woesearchaeota archaeon]